MQLMWPMSDVETLMGVVRMRHALPPPALRRALRLEAGLSLREVAVAVGVSRQAVSHWEMGERSPRSPHLERYVTVLTALREVV